LVASQLNEQVVVRRGVWKEQAQEQEQRCPPVKLAGAVGQQAGASSPDRRPPLR
jgi:hypothetical protein